MKSILFVINTMGIGGGEKAILELLRQIDLEKYEVSLFVLTGQGELINQIPEKVYLLNQKSYPISVLDRKGKIRLLKTSIQRMIQRGSVFKRTGYIIKCLGSMMGQNRIQKDKLLWKVFSDGAQRFEKEFDLAVAYLEGGSAYYVASHVNAKKKVAFIHTNYGLSGYNRVLDEDCYVKFDNVFTVSASVKASFLAAYPECAGITEVFYNLIDRNKIILESKAEGGFSDDYVGVRILTVGRLVPQKALDLAIDTMNVLKRADMEIRWYVLGEGELRRQLKDHIMSHGLEEDFILLGTVANPYPYYKQCDLYVHTAYIEGKSVAIEEAQILGCAILATEYDGVREQIEDGVDGAICEPNPEKLAEKILKFVRDPQTALDLSLAAFRRKQVNNLEEVHKLLDLLKD